MKQKNFLTMLFSFFLIANLLAADIYVGSNVTYAGATLGSEANPYSSLLDAVSAASDNDKIIIIGTVTQNDQIAFNKSLTFEGNSDATIQSTGTNRLFNISAVSAKTITFTDITFKDFNSTFQGAVLNNTLQAGMTYNFNNCNFLDNSTSADNGGGVFYFGALASTLNLTSCTFNNNAVITSTAGNARGGAINFDAPITSTITNCTFSNNKIAKNDRFGGAAIRVNNGSCNISISNSLFYNNKASNGTGDNADFNGVPATKSFTNSLAEFINNVTTTTGSNVSADFTNTTFTFVSPNLTYTAPNSSSDATPIDFGSDNNDVGAWDSGINIYERTNNGKWSNDANWSSGTAPVGDGTENVAIIGGSDCNVFDVDVAVNNIKLTIELRINQRAFKVNGESTITGGGLVRYYAKLTDDADNAKAWHLVSSPLSGEVFDTAFADINDIASGNGSNRGIATYNPGQTGAAAWTYFTGTNVPATSGQGFSMKITPDNTSFAGGEYENNDVGFEGTFNTDITGVSITTTTSGFNLLGNPYVAHINSATFLDDASGIDKSQIWVWNQAENGGDGRYESQTSGTGFILAPAQGFFVNVTTPGSLNFAESNQATTGGTFQKSARTELKLLVSDSETSRSTVVYFLNNVTKGYDFGWEGEVFGGVRNDFELFTHLVNDDEGKKYQKQSLPISEIESLVIPVGIEAESGKELVFSSESQNFPTDLKVFLEDRDNNTFTRLDEANSEYKVTLTQSLNGIGRFYIHTATGALSTDDVALENISVYATNKTTLRIVGLSQGKSNLKLYNILGKQVLNTSFTSNGVSDVNLPKLTTGVYIVQLENENGSLNKKIILE